MPPLIDGDGRALVSDVSLRKGLKAHEEIGEEGRLREGHPQTLRLGVPRGKRP